MGFGSEEKDICWDVMQNWYTVQDTERYNKFKEAFQTGKLPDGYYGKIQENGIFTAANAPMQPMRPWTNTLLA